MPASQALNETRLPRAVVNRSAAIAARYATSESELPPPEGAAPAAPEGGTPAEPAHVAELDPRESDPNYWKQRFKVTEGILARERTERRTQFEALNQRITELQEQALTQKPPPTAAEIDLTRFFTPEQIETYGEEQCQVMAQTAMGAAHSTAQELIDAAMRPIREERAREKEDAAAQAKQKFVDRLTELKPDYATIDVDPAWQAWLAEEDENGVQRQALDRKSVV